MKIDRNNPLNQINISDSPITQNNNRAGSIADNTAILPGYGYAYPSMIPKGNYDFARRNLQGDFSSVQESLNVQLSDPDTIYDLCNTGKFEIPAGSTLSEISKMFANNINSPDSWQEVQNCIMAANPQIVSPDKINAGDILIIPENIISRLGYPDEAERLQLSGEEPCINSDEYYPKYKYEQLIAGDEPCKNNSKNYYNYKREKLLTGEDPFTDEQEEFPDYNRKQPNIKEVQVIQT